MIGYVLYAVMSSIVANWADVGNSTIDVSIKNALDLRRLGSKARNFKVSTLSAKKVYKEKPQRYDEYSSGYDDYGYDAYRYDSPVEDLYDASMGGFSFSPNMDLTEEPDRVVLNPNEDYEEIPILEHKVTDIEDLSVTGEEARRHNVGDVDEL